MPSIRRLRTLASCAVVRLFWKELNEIQKRLIDLIEDSFDNDNELTQTWQHYISSSARYYSPIEIKRMVYYCYCLTNEDNPGSGSYFFSLVSNAAIRHAYSPSLEKQINNITTDIFVMR